MTSLAPLRVLLADNHAVVRKVLRECLEDPDVFALVRAGAVASRTEAVTKALKLGWLVLDGT